ncbi:MAG TPA: 50S ribosomal protein L6, partial [Armatimonadota bacterium]|nr:50S ribosomal protein L6 [Armatimonadota bacterium]
MSRIGKLPVVLPAGVTVTTDDHKVTIKGPGGELVQEIHPDITVKVEDGKILVERPSDAGPHRALHGLTRSLLANMVEGVTKGFERVLEIRGVGYRAQMQGDNLVLQVGYSHPVEIVPRPGIKFEVGQDVNTRQPFVVVKGINKQVVGQQAAEIRRVRPPEPYKGKGIRYRGEYVRLKAGKQG